MSSRRIFVLGNSHTRALDMALRKEALAEGVQIEIGWLQSDKGGRLVGNMPLAVAQERIAALGPDDLFVLSLLGAFHNIYGLLQHDQPYWVMSETGAEDEDVPVGHTLIPRRVIEAWFLQLCSGFKRMEKLLSGCRARRFHLMTPPPKGDNAFIEACTVKYRDRTVEEHGISAPALRLRLWTIEMAALAQALQAHSTRLLPPPDGCIDADGFLAPACYGNDATHANTVYGRRVLEQLASLA